MTKIQRTMRSEKFKDGLQTSKFNIIEKKTINKKQAVMFKPNKAMDTQDQILISSSSEDEGDKVTLKKRLLDSRLFVTKVSVSFENALIISSSEEESC